MRGIFVIWISFLLLCYPAQSQINEIDSLIGEAKNTNRSYTYIDQLATLQKAYNLAQDNESRYRYIEICMELGDLFYENKIYDSAIEYFRKTFVLDSKKVQYPEQIGTINRRIGQCYAQLNEPDSAFVYYEQIINTFNYPDNLELYREVVDIYSLNGLHQESLKYNLIIEKELSEHHASNESFAKIYNNIGFNYHRLRNYEKAILYFRRALNIDSNLTDSEQASILSNLGICYFNKGENEQSAGLLRQAYDLSKDERQQAEISHLMAEVFISDQDYLRAVKHFELAEVHSQHSGLDELLVDVYAGLSSAYNRTHEYDLAFEYFKSYSILRDSLKFVDELNRKRLVDNQKFIERAEKENSLLKAQQDFQRLQIQQLEIESKNQTLQTNALRSDSIRVSNELAIARQKNELALIADEKNELEIARQKNLLELSYQKLEVARSKEEKSRIEFEKQQREIELAQEKLNLQKRDAQLRDEKATNEKKQAELERGKIQQRNTLIITLLLGMLALFAGWSFLSKQKDNKRLSLANQTINQANSNLEEAESKIRKLLKQQVSGAVAETLITKGNVVTDDPQFAAIMFLDIRNFTVFCEGKKPSEIIAYQNNVFGFMINIIEKYNGVVNQFMGDGFMATFGAPISAGNDCQNAYLAAKEIVSELEERVLSKILVPTKVGIGLHAGNVVTGNVGNEERKQFSITGNTVILAARLEQLNKKYGSSLVYSREIFEQLSQQQKGEVKFEAVMVKGRTKPIDVTYL